MLPEVIEMSPKEQLYVQDAISHEKFLQKQCQDAEQTLTDPALKNFVRQLATKHQELLGRFSQLN